MTFNRINEYTVRCVLDEKEIDMMGYNLKELFQNKNLANDFLLDIIEKAKNEGFSMNDSYKSIQSMFLPNHQIVLNIFDANLDDPMDELILNYLNTYELVEKVGKERLEEILKMEGKEKMKAIRDCMKEVQGMFEESPELMDVTYENEEAVTKEVEINEMTSMKYLLMFQDLNHTEQFSKISDAVPGKLFKDKNQYFMLVDLHGMELDSVNSFILKARDYTADIREDEVYSAFLEEHGEVIIKANPIKVLKMI